MSTQSVVQVWTNEDVEELVLLRLWRYHDHPNKMKSTTNQQNQSITQATKTFQMHECIFIQQHAQQRLVNRFQSHNHFLRLQEEVL
jgi:hypothetical protein